MSKYEKMNRPYLSCIYYFIFRSFSFFDAAMYLQKLSSKFSLVLISLSLLPKAKYRFAVFLRIFVRVTYDTPQSHYVDLIFAHYLYRANYPASIHRTCRSIFCHLFPYHKVLYNAKRENFETFIRTIHGASLFSVQAIHRTLLDRVYLIAITTIQCLCLSHIRLHLTHNQPPTLKNMKISPYQLTLWIIYMTLHPFFNFALTLRDCFIHLMLCHTNYGNLTINYPLLALCN